MALHNHAPSSGQIFTLAGHGLSLNTAEDLAPHIANLIASPDIREVHLGGNTLGVRACEALARVLSTKKSLKVSSSLMLSFAIRHSSWRNDEHRLQTLPIYLPVALLPKFLLP